MTDQYGDRFKKQLRNLENDCSILKLTYSFDGETCQVFNQGGLKSKWTAEQLLRGEVYA